MRKLDGELAIGSGYTCDIVENITWKKWAADPSWYKAATSLVAKCSIRRVKDLAPGSFRSGPRIGCGSVGG